MADLGRSASVPHWLNKPYRYGPTGDITFGKPQYNNSYAYNAEDYNPNLEVQYLRARYYDVERGNFLTEDPYLGKLTDPLTLNRYNYVKSSALNYVDPSGYTSYVFFTSSEHADFSEQANWKAKQLERDGETVIIQETNSVNDFVEAWNSMGEVDGEEDSIEEVHIYTHGRPYALIFVEGSATEAISIDGKNSGGDSIPDIHELMDKAVSRLYINACNAGHLIYYEHVGQNVASVFSEKIGEDGAVYAFDGNVSFGPHSWEFWEDNNFNPRLSSGWSQRTYNEYKRKYSLTNPQPKGQIIYHDGKRQNFYSNTTIRAARK